MELQKRYYCVKNSESFRYETRITGIKANE